MTRIIELLADGHLPSNGVSAPSPYPTGAALIAIASLQNRLQLRFHNLQNVLQLLHKRTLALTGSITQTRKQAIASFSPQQTQALDHLEKSLISYRNLIEEALQQLQVYESDSEMQSPVPSSTRNGHLSGYEQ